MSIGLKYFWKDNKENSLRWKLRNLRWELRYAWRRAWYGFDDIDIIGMHDRFVERYKAILKDFRNNYHCLFNVPDEYKDIYNKEFFSKEESNIIIETMIYHLEMMNEDYVEKIIYGKNIYDDDYEIGYGERIILIISVMEQNKEAFMKLFNIFFWQLWD